LRYRSGLKHFGLSHHSGARQERVRSRKENGGRRIKLKKKDGAERKERRKIERKEKKDGGRRELEVANEAEITVATGNDPDRERRFVGAKSTDGDRKEDVDTGVLVLTGVWSEAA